MTDPIEVETTFLPYADWSPMAHDQKGLNCPDQQDWYVAEIGINRDSELLSESNWECFIAALEEIDPEGNDYVVGEFGHWACGWFKIVQLRPNSKAHAEAQKICDALREYPVVSDEHFSEKEWDTQCEMWENGSIQDRIEWCNDAEINFMASRRDTVPHDECGSLRETMLGC